MYYKLSLKYYYYFWVYSNKYYYLLKKKLNLPLKLLFCQQYSITIINNFYLKFILKIL